jgi:hypothetical protein
VSAGDDRRLVRVSEICLALPEATREDNPPHAIFRVRRRTFAYYLDDHHGDGVVGLVCKAPAGANEALVEAEPERFYKPAYVGHRGWIGLRLDLAHVDWDEVADFAAESYVLVAPKRLAAQLDQD